MQVLFHVDGFYKDTDKTRLVLYGNVINGIIYSNMTLLIPINKSLDVTALIALIDTTELVSTQDSRLKVYI